MDAIVGTIVGGLLTIAGGLVGASVADRRVESRWRQDAQLRATTQLLGALQTLMRRMIDFAYLEDKADRRSATIQNYHEASVGWNSAMYAALLVSLPGPATQIAPLDREVDRLLDLAASKQWTRDEFRQERVGLGRLAAAYLRTSRREAGFPDIALPSIWTWDADEAAAAP
jgi:hypothetical protein